MMTLEEVRQAAREAGAASGVSLAGEADAVNIAGTDDVANADVRLRYRRIPICRELYADQRTPIQVLRILKAVSSHCYLLESVEDSRQWGRYTFLGYDPAMEIVCRGNRAVVTGPEGVREEEISHPREIIRQVLAEYKSPKVKGMPPFTGGLVGYFSYDYVKYGEPVLRTGAAGSGDAARNLEKAKAAEMAGETKSQGNGVESAESDFPDADLMLFDKVIAFDQFRQKILLIDNVRLDCLEEDYRRAEADLKAMEELIRHGTEAPAEGLELKSEFRPAFTKEEYCAMVEAGKKHILEGDIFQVVLSNELEAEFAGSLLNAYRVLRTTNPSPYMFYFSGNVEIAGASPETLAKLTDGCISTFPLAGTRPRGKTDEEDARLEKELLADEKELAEHNMLVDLGRNDIGRVSRIGSVKVEKYLSIERYSHVMHIGSTITGRLREDKDALDALDAILPAGTLSGAPKIRACQIIEELEGGRRGIYGGAVGYLDFSGNMDVCIAIRLAYARDGKVTVRSGAGNVADSVPELEYQECLNKARAVLNAIETAGKGEDL